MRDMIDQLPRKQVTTGTTVPPPNPGDLGSVLNRNVDVLQARRKDEERAASRQDKVAESIMGSPAVWLSSISTSLRSLSGS